jgi:hypothetical protein
MYDMGLVEIGDYIRCKDGVVRKVVGIYGAGDFGVGEGCHLEDGSIIGSEEIDYDMVLLESEVIL